MDKSEQELQGNAGGSQVEREWEGNVTVTVTQDTLPSRHKQSSLLQR
jgi:hypothetical protein